MGYREAVCALTPVSNTDLVIESGVVSCPRTTVVWALCHLLPLLLLKD